MCVCVWAAGEEGKAGGGVRCSGSTVPPCCCCPLARLTCSGDMFCWRVRWGWRGQARVAGMGLVSERRWRGWRRRAHSQVRRRQEGAAAGLQHTPPPSQSLTMAFMAASIIEGFIATARRRCVGGGFAPVRS